MISVGIDISKGKSMVCMLKPYGEVIASPYEIEHTGKQMDELCHGIITMGKEIQVEW